MECVRLELVNRPENKARYYEVEVGADLFGGWVVECRWGRIGSDGDGASRRISYTSEAAALGRLREIVAEQQAGGYRLVHGDATGLGAISAPAAADLREANRCLLVADELDRLLQTLPQRDSRFGQIAASLASACRRTGRSRSSAMAERRQRAAWVYDDTEFRIRARIFALLDELIAGALGPDEAERISFRLVQDFSSAAASGDVVAMVPRTLFATLNRPVDDVLAGDRTLILPCRRLAEIGVVYVGDLVALAFPILLGACGGRRDLALRIERRLWSLGLRLNCRPNGWRRPASLLEAAIG